MYKIQKYFEKGSVMCNNCTQYTARVGSESVVLWEKNDEPTWFLAWWYRFKKYKRWFVHF